jgi:CRISPR-associated protein Cas5t
VIPALHVRMSAYTASFRHPLIISGTQLTTPMPALSNLLGVMSACAGRAVSPSETRIGFEFRTDNTFLEIERTVRFQMDKLGRLRPHAKGQGLVNRQVHSKPQLDLFVTNVDLRAVFERPAATPWFGRSQDIAWIEFVRDVELTETASGAIGPTLVPFAADGPPGLIMQLPEWFENSTEGQPRVAGPFRKFHAMWPHFVDFRFAASMANLFHPSDAEGAEDVIYLHQWTRVPAADSSQE